MKKIILVLALCLIGLSSNAQTKLLLNGLVKANQMTSVNVKQFDYQLVTPRVPGQRSQGNSYLYVVTRNMDGNSAKIEDAAKRGVAFDKAHVWMKDFSGAIRKFKLTNVSIINYSNQYPHGKTPTEEFTVLFQNRTPL